MSIVETSKNQIVLHKPDSDGETPKPFTFDYVYGVDSRQQDVFNETAKPIVDSVIGGYNGTIFAYGQTGTGKTFSMEGVPNDPDLRGIMPNSFHHICEMVQNAGKDTEFLVRMSFLEIYKEDVFDLLNKNARQKCEVKESKEKGVFVKDLSTYVVKTVPDMMKVLDVGQGQRQVGATAMNAGSSRSHSILTITIETSVHDLDTGEAKYKVGKLNLVDLAGSERQKRTGAEGDRLDEAKSINLSLSALGNVIKALVTNNAKHVPFRDSKLTRLLQDSLGGNTKTCMLAAMGPGAMSYDETLSTLRYANRAKNIKNKPKINEDPKDAMLREMQDQIALLRAQLEARKKGLPVPTKLDANYKPGSSFNGDDQMEEKLVENVEVVDTGIREEDLEALQRALKEEEAMLEGKTEAEKQQYMEQKAAAEKAAKEREEALRRQKDEQDKATEEIQRIENELREKETKISTGQKDIEEARAAETAYKEVEARLQAQRQEEEKALQELEAREEAELCLAENYDDAKEELKVKSKKLKKLWIKYGEKKEDLEDLHEEFALEREDMVDTIRALNRQIMLKHLIVDAFVPPKYAEMIEQSALWDSVNDRWVIGGLNYAANNVERVDTRHDFNPGMNYAQYMDNNMGTGAAFDPAGQGRQMSAEMEHRFRMALQNDGSPQKEVFYSYGPGMDKKTKKNARPASAARNRRR